MNILFPYDPSVRLDRYLDLDEWTLFREVRQWLQDRNPRRESWDGSGIN